MALSAMVGHELRSRSRERSFAYVAVAFVVACATVVVTMYRAATGARRGSGTSSLLSASVGRLVAHVLLVLVLIAMCVVVPWLAARTVAGERETGELLALQIGPSRPLTIAVAKTGTVFAQFLVLFFVAVPFLTFAHLLGGVTPRELLRGTAMILAFALALSAWCVALASYTQRAARPRSPGTGLSRCWCWAPCWRSRSKAQCAGPERPSDSTTPCSLPIHSLRPPTRWPDGRAATSGSRPRSRRFSP